MSLPFGIERCKIDTNGRFKLPVSIKKGLETDDVRFVIRRSVSAPCLELWTYAGFQEERNFLQNELNRYNREDLSLLRKLLICSTVELDSNDRILIPPEQKEYLKPTKEIVLQSLGEYIEIWDRDAFAKLDDDTTDYAALADQRLGKIRRNSSQGTADGQ